MHVVFGDVHRVRFHCHVHAPERLSEH
jgi:hypothetical protein